jgi:hypothetical protein
VISISAMPDTKGDANQDSASREDAIDRPLEYLFASSGASIESFHLSRLNVVANLRKELHEIFEEWVEAEVQARLAQWLLARKNSETLADAVPITIDAGENRNPQIPDTRSTARSPTRTATRRTAAADSAVRSCIARLNSRDSDSSNHLSINSSIRTRAIRTKNRAPRALTAKLTSRPVITRSAIVTRTQRFPVFAHPPDARPESANISKPTRTTPTLLSFRRPNRHSIAI